MHREEDGARDCLRYPDDRSDVMPTCCEEDGVGIARVILITAVRVRDCLRTAKA